jgi:hypothetical protein
MNKLTSGIKGLHIEATHHATAILEQDLPQALTDLQGVLSGFEIKKAEVIQSGGGETKITQRLRNAFSERGWVKRNVLQEHIVDGVELPSESHEIDHIKAFPGGRVALEIEWNNKDPFFDRDLENFRKLHQIGFISVGIIITRGPNLQARLPEIFIEHYSSATTLEAVECTPKQRAQIKQRIARGATLGQATGAILAAHKFGAATTHWDKLRVRVHERAQGKPCPLLLIGIGIEKFTDFNPSEKVDVGPLPVAAEEVAAQETLDIE